MRWDTILSSCVFFCLWNAAAQDTIRVGSPLLHGAVPAIGTISIESYEIHGGVKTPVSRSVLTIARAEADGVPVYAITTGHWAAGMGDSGVTHITVRRDDFALVRYKVKASHDSAVVVYSNGHLTGWVILPNQPVMVFDTQAPRPVIPVDGPAPWLLTALPLAENFSAVIPRYSMWDQAEEIQTIRVEGTESLERNGRSIECWKVDGGPFAIPGYRAYLWVDKKTKKILQTLLRGKPDQPEYWSISE